ncbi:hypothetical protein ACWDYJ_21725 [Streptomyces sp. NPDC003042]
MDETLKDFLEALSPESRARVEREAVGRQRELAAQWQERLEREVESRGTDFLVPGMSKAAHEAEYVVSTSLEQRGET